MHNLLRILLLGTCAAAAAGLAVSWAVSTEPTGNAPISTAAAESPREWQLTDSDNAVASADKGLSEDRPSESRVGDAAYPRVEAPYLPPISQDVKELTNMLKQAQEAQQQGRNAIQDAVSQIREQLDGGLIGLPAEEEPAAGPSQAETLPPAAAGTDKPAAAAPDKPGVADIRRAEGDEGLSINLQNADIRQVLEMLGEQGGFNILMSPNVQGTVSATLTGVDIATALNAILRNAGFDAMRDGRFLFVGTKQDLAQMQFAGDKLTTRIYRPNYVTAAEMQALITPMLSPEVGQIAISSATETGIAPNDNEAGGDRFGGQEVLLVRDYESVLWQIDQVLAEVDKRPRQVVIEALILSVKLDDSVALGVDFELLRDNENIRVISGAPLSNLANISLAQDGLKVGFLDTSLSAFVEALETVGDTNVIAAPRVLCLNKQKAEVQIGSDLGYVSTTVTENASTQAVEFLQVGTQLRLRPFISDDGFIRMEVHPELSTGNVRIEGGFTLPDKEVTKVTTNIMCHDGSTVVIGGLIREDLTASASQIPIFGVLPIVGPAFRNRTETVARTEIIVLITPRLVYEPLLDKEGRKVAQQFTDRAQVYADKMSPIGRRYHSRRYLRMAQAAWNAGDAKTALEYINLAIHFDALSSDAIELRREIVETSGVQHPAVDWHLREGLPPWQHPHQDYSQRGFPWQPPPQPLEAEMMPDIYDPGQPGSSRDLMPLERYEK